MNIEQELEVSSSTQVGSSDMCDASGSDLAARLRKLLYRRMLIGIKDGRFFLGYFHCIDKHGNIVLQDTVEYRTIQHASPSQWSLGVNLIPSSCRISCHVDCAIEEQLPLLKCQD